MAPARHDTEKDPVVSEYDIFITPSPAEKVLVLQYPIRKRKDLYNRNHGAMPREMRIKSDSGFVEIDVDMDPVINFNKNQGLEWGKAMQRAKANGLTTFGASAGFGPGAIKPEGRKPKTEDYAEPDLYNYKEILADKRVHRKQTIGGQIQKAEDDKPQYMLGAFKGKELHLTKVDGIAQLRPQFHHVDAAAHVERAANQREPEEGRTAQARGFTQTYKSNRDDDPRVGNEKSLMQLAQEEKWTCMNYFDEEDDEAFEAYKRLFVQDTSSAEPLHSSMTNEQYLDAISAPRHDPSGRRKKKPLTRKQREAIELGDDDADRPGDVAPTQT